VTDRVQTALVLGPLFLTVLLLGGAGVFAAAVALVACRGAWEARRLACAEGNPVEEAFVAGWAGVVVLGFLSRSAALPGALLALGVLIYLGGWVFGPGPAPDTLRRWGAAAGAWLLVAFFLGHAVWVRRHGISPVLFLLGVVWAGDTAAYYTGRTFGSSPLAPAVSPKKTLEGSAGGLVASAAVAGALTVLLPVPHSLVGGLLLGMALNLVAQTGDLLESLLKRCAGVKDSGSLFPGHGGVLDRVDGFLPTLPLYAAVLALWG
jgi:phosphatidate cytidylyltransferase